MDIFCEGCQKNVGQIADEKIPVGKQLSVSCPKCGAKIHFSKPEELSAELDFLEEESVSSAELCDNESETTAEQEVFSGNKLGQDFGALDLIIREAWVKTCGIKGPIWGSIVLAFFATMLFFIVVIFISKIASISAMVPAVITFFVAIFPFMAGLALFGIRRSIDLPVDYKLAFSCFGYILPIIISSFLISLLSGLGFILFILPGMYLSIAYLFTIPLIIDRGMSPWLAMETSRKAVNRHWFTVFGLYYVMSFICSISAIPLGLGLVWTIPMFIMVGGILYRDIFGVCQNA